MSDCRILINKRPSESQVLKICENNNNSLKNLMGTKISNLLHEVDNKIQTNELAQKSGINKITEICKSLKKDIAQNEAEIHSKVSNVEIEKLENSIRELRNENLNGLNLFNRSLNNIETKISELKRINVF